MTENNPLTAPEGTVTRFYFGNHRILRKRTIDLVAAGIKTATCLPLRMLADDGDAPPKVGRRELVMDWDNTPALIVETVSVEEIPFAKMSDEIILAFGEHVNADDWREDMLTFFKDRGGLEPETIMHCTRFKFIEDLREDPL